MSDLNSEIKELYKIAKRMRHISAQPEFGGEEGMTEFVELAEFLASWIDPNLLFLTMAE